MDKKTTKIEEGNLKKKECYKEHNRMTANNIIKKIKSEIFK